MMKRKEYLLHLIGELTHFILDSKPSRMVVSLHQEPDGVHLCIIDNYARTEKELDVIRESLNCSRRPELAGYYGTMAGQELLGEARLNLIGWQVKHADVSSTGDGIKIDLWLGGDDFDPDNFSIPSV